jgi:ketosteroid isomerase-like protein
MIPDRPLSEATASERLARRWFATIQRGAYDEVGELLHDDVELVSKVRPGTTVHGRGDVTRFLEEEVAPNLFQAAADLFTPVDDERVIVEGRVRWIDDERVIRDDPVIWAVEFRDERLFRFVATRTMLEAEAVLGRPAESDAERT